MNSIRMFSPRHCYSLLDFCHLKLYFFLFFLFCCLLSSGGINTTYAHTFTIQFNVFNVYFFFLSFLPSFELFLLFFVSFFFLFYNILKMDKDYCIICKLFFFFHIFFSNIVKYFIIYFAVCCSLHFALLLLCFSCVSNFKHTRKKKK